MEKIMAVLTGERTYGERLCAYANYKRSLPFTAVSFNSGQAYENFAKRHKIGVLLTDGHVEKEHMGFREGRSSREELIIGLFDETDEESVFNYTEGPGIDAYTLIPKYQSAEKIMRSVMSCCNAMGVEMSAEDQRSSAHIVGVYSPDPGVQKAAYAMTLARALSSKRRTLFLSFEEFSGFAGITGESYGVSLSDGMLSLKQGRLDPERLGSLIHTYSGIDYIPPIQYADDMKGITGEDCAQLLRSVIRCGSYEVMVVDLPSAFSMAEDMMDICHEIYVPEKDDFMGRVKVEEFMRYLEFCKKLRLISKLNRFELCMHLPAFSGSSYMDTLFYGELGDKARAHAEHIICR